MKRPLLLQLESAKTSTGEEIVRDQKRLGNAALQHHQAYTTITTGQLCEKAVLAFFFSICHARSRTNDSDFTQQSCS